MKWLFLIMICPVVMADQILSGTIDNENSITIVIDDPITFTDLIDNSSGIFFTDLNNCGDIELTISGESYLTSNWDYRDCTTISQGASAGSFPTADNQTIIPDDEKRSDPWNIMFFTLIGVFILFVIFISMMFFRQNRRIR